MNSRKDLSNELEQLQQRLGGRRYWQSLEELAESDAFAALVEQEFPEQADVWPDALSRRRFLTLMAASFALGGVIGCSVGPAPAAKIVPYVHPPEGIVPGRPLFYATTMTLGGDAVGLLVESHMGRPTKIEGNPDHPASRGASSAFHQASILTLYDPDRSQTVTFNGQIRGWSDADKALRDRVAREQMTSGAGLRLLTPTVASPTLAAQIESLLAALPKAKWHQYQPINDDAALAGAELAFGEKVSANYDFRKSDVVVSLDCDFLASGPGHLKYASEFMARRRVSPEPNSAPRATMSRLYVAETMVSCTGAKADHRLALRGDRIEPLARALAAELGAISESKTVNEHQKWIGAVANDLKDHPGRCLVLAGPRQPPAVHALVHALNAQLRNVGQTVAYVQPAALNPVHHVDSLRELVDDIQDKRVETLLILGGNPAYDAPADLDFATLLQYVPLRFHLSLYNDETSRLCQWHLPAAHDLESWSDARALGGTASIVQPLIEPLYHGRSSHEIVALLASDERVPGDQIVKAHWRKHAASPRDELSFDEWWQTALHDGVIAGTEFSTKDVSLQDGWQSRLNRAGASAAAPREAADLEIGFHADPTVFDGSFANNGWLQELPKPLTKLTWDNAAIMSPALAAELGLTRGDYAHGGEHGGYYMPLVELQQGGRRVQAPVWIMPGHAERAITVHLGYGRRSAGRVGGDGQHKVGFDAYALRSAAQPWFAPGLEVTKLAGRYPLACTQAHHSLGERDIIHAGTLAQYQTDPRSVHLPPHEPKQASELPQVPATIYEPFDDAPPQHKWGMLIDMTACLGCSACVVACQAENNIPVVGKEQVLAGREMHWLRIDRYLSGPAAAPSEYHFQPLPCMHCEHAPCEYVCPVAATVHSAEGLNEMVYNRCVGTRFCSNNCPYKVRRFNFLAYADYDAQQRRLQYNPDVTVRSRGVMEKCTYCVQRIRTASIDADAANRPLQDGEIITACQAACPTQAIVFGDLNDPHSEIHRRRQSPLEYGLLAELNTRPRTTYLAELRNPNPELELA